MISAGLLLTSLMAGFLGALLGLGGGIIIVPALTLLFKIDIRYAIAASLVSIVATSSGAAYRFLREKLTNVRLAVILQVGTVSGAITGFFISGLLETKFLYLLFGLFLLFSALMMLRKRSENISNKEHHLAQKLKLSSVYKDSQGNTVPYKVENVTFGLITMYLAGILSALLGIGSGVFKVLSMDIAMKLPIKVSSATSNFMIGITATASAGAFFLKGDVRPEIAGPVALGVVLGSRLGAKVMLRISSESLRKVFLIVLIIISVQMISRGL